jgi:tetratricopeptide (TPR) repeat protein
MALGLGFNKQKALQAAERCMLQGKLQNAIDEYQKILKNDPRDLTVLNTVGELHVRMNRVDEGAQCFRKVAESYASDGFMVKAIAMYKKLAKLSPDSADCRQKLAELYSSQGLFSDARAQYASLAEFYLQARNSEAAIAVLRKALELDPENTRIQQRLADLYAREGRSTDAAEIYLMAAQSRHCRHNLPGAQEAVDKVLALQPRHEAALLLRARIAIDSGQPVLAMQALESLPELDQRPEALRELLRASAAAGNLGSTEAAALKLVRVHNDASGILAAASAMVAAGECERALRLVRDHVEAVASASNGPLVDFLNETLNAIRTHAPALELLVELYRVTGAEGSGREASELLAQAYCEQGRLSEARELYRHLAELEPENPIHSQNVAQIAAQLGDLGDNGEPAALQASMPEELDETERSVGPRNLPEIEQAIETALTESELYQSYNAIPKAIAPLEKTLKRAPEDVRLNQRLAALYVRSERYADAAARFALLRVIFDREGLENESTQCAEMEQKYRDRAAARPQPPAPEVAEDADETAAGPESTAPVREFAVAASGDEWESIAEVDVHSAEAAQEVPGQKAAPAHDVEVEEVGEQDKPSASPVGEALDEARFYMLQGMQREAEAALAHCQQLAPDSSDVQKLAAELLQHFPNATIPAIKAASARPAAAPSKPEGVAVESDQDSGFDSGWQVDQTLSVESAEAASIDLKSDGASEDEFSLGGVFEELRASVEDTAADDLDTRYNLGIALKDMGLLDEAIGELQRVCNAIERGAPFGEAVQAYTWLAQCLVERGFPQAAFKWYQRALALPGLDAEAAVAIHYDLGQAYQRAGQESAALDHYMQAYSSNIDFRDVAERIEALQG